MLLSSKAPKINVAKRLTPINGRTASRIDRSCRACRRDDWWRLDLLPWRSSFIGTYKVYVFLGYNYI